MQLFFPDPELFSVKLLKCLNALLCVHRQHTGVPHKLSLSQRTSCANPRSYELSDRKMGSHLLGHVMSVLIPYCLKYFIYFVPAGNQHQT